MAELIWDGKYDKDGRRRGPVRVALPFQTVETVNESAQDRQRSLELFGSGGEPEWRNRLIWGDKKYVLPSLLPEFAGKVDLIYIDPPFDTGADFTLTASIPAGAVGAEAGTSAVFNKEPSVIEQKAYRDTWSGGLDSYLRWFFETASLLHGLLSERGSLYVHLDWHVSFYVKAVLDELFGEKNFQSEVIWKRKDSNRAGTTLATVTDTILFYSRSEAPRWSLQYVPYSAQRLEKAYSSADERGKYALADLMAPGDRAGTRADYEWNGVRPRRGRHWAYTLEKMRELEREGRIFWNRAGTPKLKVYLAESKGVPLANLWTDIAMVKGGGESVAYPTQKPEALLERILRCSSNVNDLVLDCFAGSGTTATVAERLGRRWVACDLSRFAIHTTRKRLLGIPNVQPFVIQNLGKYERQVWQAAEFPMGGSGLREEQRQREVAYRRFILDLYRATPVSGYSWLHGAKSGRMVHVGAVDAPVTEADVKSIAAEVWKAAGRGKGGPETASVDVLGWEFAFDLNETARETAAASRVDVRFKRIPREVLDPQAVKAGDVQFFELGALSVEQKLHDRELKIELTDFVIPLDDVPEEARRAIRHWSQMIDYWAVDWDYRNDTFHNQWQSYRTRKDPGLELSASHNYAEPGKYTVVVKVVDILGNDTTKAFAVEIGAQKVKAKGA